jgi:hypothetical protein
MWCLIGDNLLGLLKILKNYFIWLYLSKRNLNACGHLDFHPTAFWWECRFPCREVEIRISLALGKFFFFFFLPLKGQKYQYFFLYKHALNIFNFSMLLFGFLFFYFLLLDIVMFIQEKLDQRRILLWLISFNATFWVWLWTFVKSAYKKRGTIISQKRDTNMFY